MTDHKNLSEELLKQNGLDAKDSSAQALRRTQEILAKEFKRANRLRLTSRILWLSIVIWLVIVLILSNICPKFPVLELTMLGCYILGICAIICSIMTYVASRNVTLKQIQASLAEISEELKRQSRDS